MSSYKIAIVSIYGKKIQNLLRKNLKVGNLVSWYEASAHLALPSFFKVGSQVDLTLVRKAHVDFPMTLYWKTL